MRSPIALILVAGSFSACVGSSLKSWRVQPPPPATVVTEQHPKRIRVSRTDNTRIVLRNPAVIGDSLVALDAANRRVALLLTQVTQVEVEKTDGGKVTFAVVGGAAGAVLLIYLLANAGTGY
jgi:ABC-type Fe3+-hydroxamate transport system substrate-binding protein